MLNEQHLVLNDSFTIEMSFENFKFAARKKYRADFSDVDVGACPMLNGSDKCCLGIVI